jgi:hypothetical protein
MSDWFYLGSFIAGSFFGGGMMSIYWHRRFDVEAAVRATRLLAERKWRMRDAPDVPDAQEGGDG